MLPVQGAQVQYLVGELDPTCMPQLGVMLQLRVRMPQLRSPHAATKKKDPACHKEDPACRN